MSSKRSGWANWRAGYGKDKRARDLPRPHNARQLTKFGEQSRGPVASAMWESDLLEYDESGALRVNEGATHGEVLRVVESSKDASYSKDYLIKLEQEASAARGGSGLTYKQAENKINRDYAARASGVLLAAKQGKIALPRAQRERLQVVAGGKYLDTVYGRYASGERGTLLGVKPREKRSNSEESTRHAQEFREFLAVDVRHGDRFERVQMAELRL